MMLEAMMAKMQQISRKGLLPEQEEPMDRLLRESKPRGSFLFPFELYHTEDSTGNYYVSSHWHTDTEIIYLQEGKIRLTINGVSQSVCAGTIIFINREEIHGLYAETEQIRYDAAVFPMEFLSFSSMDYCQQKYLLPIIQKKLEFPRFLFSDNPCFDEIKAQLARLASLQEQLPKGYQLAIKAALFQILSCLVQADALDSSGHRTNPLDEKRLETMRGILTFIEEHMGEKLTLSQMAEQFYMTPESFCRYFKKHFGCSFTHYVNEIRLEKACRMLSASTLPVMEIGFLCGFENFSYFIRLFKKKLGQTPLVYRQTHPLNQP